DVGSAERSDDARRRVLSAGDALEGGSGRAAVPPRVLDRYAVANATFVLVAVPHSGPRRAERARQIQSASRGRSAAAKGISRASPWLALPCPSLVQHVAAPCGARHLSRPPTAVRRFLASNRSVVLPA